MRTRWLGTLAAVVVALSSPLLASAVDSPHDASFSDGSCDNCHLMYDVDPLTASRSYNKGCIACHNNPVNHGGPSGFPWQTGDQGVPGVVGDQHSWSGPAVNAARGVKGPQIYALYTRLVDGKLQCTTCHDAHSASAQYAPGSRQTSMPIGVPRNASSGVGGGQMTLVSAETTVAKGYRVAITEATATGGAFVVSHDFGLATPTWFAWNGAAWVASGAAQGQGRPFTNGAPVALDDAGVTVSFTGGYVPGDSWDFYVSFPFLRASNVGDGLCASCHSERIMNDAKGGGRDPTAMPNGTLLFSHPVNVPLNANGRGYDVTEPNILDANGLAQSAGDGDRSNDLRLDGGIVRCTTCHAVHNADSNSLTQDAR